MRWARRLPFSSAEQSRRDAHQTRRSGSARWLSAEVKIAIILAIGWPRVGSPALATRTLLDPRITAIGAPAAPRRSFSRCCRSWRSSRCYGVLR